MEYFLYRKQKEDQIHEKLFLWVSLSISQRHLNSVLELQAQWTVKNVLEYMINRTDIVLLILYICDNFRKWAKRLLHQIFLKSCSTNLSGNGWWGRIDLLKRCCRMAFSRKKSISFRLSGRSSHNVVETDYKIPYRLFKCHTVYLKASESFHDWIQAYQSHTTQRKNVFRALKPRIFHLYLVTCTALP